MLSKKRIEEAEKNIKIYLDDGLLKKITQAQTKDNIAQKIFMKNAKDSLKAAKLLLENEIPLWTIVASYYSMFYMANAVLINLGYKTGDKIVHKVTADTLIAIVKNKLTKQIIENYEEVAEEALNIAEIKSTEIIETFDYERRKRSHIQYQTTITDITTKAKTSLQRAQEFLFEMEGLL